MEYPREVISRAHKIQLCLQEAFVPAGVKSPTANRQRAEIQGKHGSYLGRGGGWGAGEQLIFTFSGQHTTKRDTFKKAVAGAGGKAVVFPWLQHAWCSSIHVWTPYLQKVPVKLAAVLQSWAETSAGEGCERAGEKTDEFGKLWPHGKVIKQ